MKYRDKPVRDVDTKQLLFEILSREGYDEAPSKTERFGDHIESVIGIGEDHVAYVGMPEDDWIELNHIVAEYENH